MINPRIRISQNDGVQIMPWYLLFLKKNMDVENLEGVEKTRVPV